MSELTILHSEEQEITEPGSFNHALVLSNLCYLLRKYTEYTIFSKLSLDSAALDKNKFPNSQDELIIDVCVYTTSKRALLDFDILVMREMPQLAIEVLSPQESSLSLFEKFQAYFVLGIHSCWLVDPATETVYVYDPGRNSQVFITDEVVDDVVGIKIPVAEIFE